MFEALVAQLANIKKEYRLYSTIYFCGDEDTVEYYQATHYVYLYYDNFQDNSI